MTLEDIYKITQTVDNTYESIRLSWFEGNIPLKECWKSKECYYLSHDEYNVTLFYLDKIDGKYKKNIVVVSSHKIVEQEKNKTDEILSIHDIIEVNGKTVRSQSNFDNGWLLQWENFKSNIDYWMKVAQTQFGTKFSSQFEYEWFGLLKEIITYRDLESVYEINKGYIHKKALDKIISNLHDICDCGVIYTRNWVDGGKPCKKDLELFTFLSGIFEEKA